MLKMRKIKASISNLAFDLKGNQVLSLVTKNDCRGIFDDLKDKDLSVELKIFRKDRSLNANSYFWVLLDELCAKMRTSKEETYRRYIKDLGGNCETVCVKNKAVKKLCEGWEHNGLGWQTDTMSSKLDGCTNVILYYGSSTYNTEQMSRLIDMVVQDCKAVGIETMTPAELAVVLNDWRA